jgi:glycosyltransferase involved in cell wall biosynthesis
VPKRRGLVVLAIIDEWLPSRGGITAFNRYFSRALSASGAEVYCVVPDVSELATADAEKAGVHLIAARKSPGMSVSHSLMLRPALPDGVTPDLVIGHGRITGPMAKFVTDVYYPNAIRIHIVHMDPNLIEFSRLGRDYDPARVAEDRYRLELDLGIGPNVRMAAVGRTLCERLERDLFSHGVSPIRLDPGFDGLEAGPGEPPRGTPLILMMGRLGDPLKGVDIAARAIGRAAKILNPPSDWDILLRGTPEGQSQQIVDQVRKLIDHASVNPYAYNHSTVLSDLEKDLRRASLLLMPSLVDAFGLSGSEAIAAATPALISARTGLGALLRQELSPGLANQVVVPITGDTGRDTEEWSYRLHAVLSNLPAAFVTAQQVRAVMVAKRTWSSAVDHLLASLGGSVTPVDTRL